MFSFLSSFSSNRLTDFAGDDLGRTLHVLCVFLGKTRIQRTVDIQYSRRCSRRIVQHDDQLAVARSVAGNMPGKRVNVRNKLCSVLCNRRSANADPNRNTRAGRLTLKRAEAERAILQQIKPDPIDVWQELVEKRAGIGKRGDKPVLRVQKMFKILEEAGYLQQTNEVSKGYTFTGKVDYLLQLIAFINENTPHISDDQVVDQIDPQARLEEAEAPEAGAA